MYFATKNRGYSVTSVTVTTRLRGHIQDEPNCGKQAGGVDHDLGRSQRHEVGNLQTTLMVILPQFWGLKDKDPRSEPPSPVLPLTPTTLPWCPGPTTWPTRSACCSSLRRFTGLLRPPDSLATVFSPYPRFSRRCGNISPGFSCFNPAYIHPQV